MCNCEICNKTFSNLGYLQSHLRVFHKMNIHEIEEYYIKYHKTENEGIDPITGGNTEFIGMKRGYKKYEKDNNKKLATNTVEHYLLKGLSLSEAQERVEKTNRKSSEILKLEWEKAKKSGKTLGGWSKKHFMELGFTEEEADIEIKKRSISREKKMSQYRKKAKESGEYKKYTSTCIEYYLNKGFSEDDAKVELKKRQTTNTIENYIKKYGETEGPIKFQERNSKWSADIEERYHNGEFNKDSNKNGNGICNKIYSNLEKELALRLFTILNDKISDFLFYSICTEKNKQYFIFESKKYYFYDITFFYNGKKKIIEFNGDYWHMNPQIYNEHDFNNSKKMYAQEIWDMFNKKIKIANDKGFQTFVVWEKDWNEDKEKIINDCINFLLYD